MLAYFLLYAYNQSIRQIGCGDIYALMMAWRELVLFRDGSSLNEKIYF